MKTYPDLYDWGGDIVVGFRKCWAKIANCSKNTVIRDINDLIEKKLVQKETAGGQSTSYILLSGKNVHFEDFGDGLIYHMIRIQGLENGNGDNFQVIIQST